MIKAFNPEQVERMRAEDYLDHIDNGDLDGCERFKVAGNLWVELVFLQ